jgi:hypothetical protein
LPYIILFSIWSLGYLVLLYTLTIPSSLPFYHSKETPMPSDSLLQKHTTFFHLYAFTWMLLVLATLGITCLNPGLGGGYLISIWSLCAGVGCLLVGIEALLSPSTRRSNGYEGGVEENAHADETTPLISREDEDHAP